MGLLNPASVVIFLRWPLVDIQSSVGGAGVQHNAILERHNEESRVTALARYTKERPRDLNKYCS